MSQEDQQQQGQQEQQSEQQQELSSEQRLGRALTEIRKVQNMMELNYPDQGNAIHMLRESGGSGVERDKERSAKGGPTAVEAPDSRTSVGSDPPYPPNEI